MCAAVTRCAEAAVNKATSGHRLSASDAEVIALLDALENVLVKLLGGAIDRGIEELAAAQDAAGMGRGALTAASAAAECMRDTESHADWTKARLVLAYFLDNHCLDEGLKFLFSKSAADIAAWEREAVMAAAVSLRPVPFFLLPRKGRIDVSNDSKGGKPVAMGDASGGSNGWLGSMGSAISSLWYSPAPAAATAAAEHEEQEHSGGSISVTGSAAVAVSAPATTTPAAVRRSRAASTEACNGAGSGAGSAVALGLSGAAPAPLGPTAPVVEQTPSLLHRAFSALLWPLAGSAPAPPPAPITWRETAILHSSSTTSGGGGPRSPFGRPLSELARDPRACLHAALQPALSVPDLVHDVSKFMHACASSSWGGAEMGSDPSEQVPGLGALIAPPDTIMARVSPLDIGTTSSANVVLGDAHSPADAHAAAGLLLYFLLRLPTPPIPLSRYATALAAASVGSGSSDPAASTLNTLRNLRALLLDIPQEHVMLLLEVLPLLAWCAGLHRYAQQHYAVAAAAAQEEAEAEEAASVESEPPDGGATPVLESPAAIAAAAAEAEAGGASPSIHSILSARSARSAGSSVHSPLLTGRRASRAEEALLLRPLPGPLAARLDNVARIFTPALLRPVGDVAFCPAPSPAASPLPGTTTTPASASATSGGLDTPLPPSSLVGDECLPVHSYGDGEYATALRVVQLLILHWRWLLSDAAAHAQALQHALLTKLDRLRGTHTSLITPLDISGGNALHATMLRQLWSLLCPAVRGLEAAEWASSAASAAATTNTAASLLALTQSTTTGGSSAAATCGPFELEDSFWKSCGFATNRPVLHRGGELGLRSVLFLAATQPAFLLSVVARVNGRLETGGMWRTAAERQGAEAASNTSGSSSVSASASATSTPGARQKSFAAPAALVGEKDVTFYPFTDAVATLTARLAEALKLHGAVTTAAAAATAAAATPGNRSRAGSTVSSSTSFFSPAPASAPMPSSAASGALSDGRRTRGPSVADAADAGFAPRVFSPLLIASAVPSLWRLCDGEDYSVEGSAGGSARSAVEEAAASGSAPSVAVAAAIQAASAGISTTFLNAVVLGALILDAKWCPQAAGMAPPRPDADASLSPSAPASATSATAAAAAAQPPPRMINELSSVVDAAVADTVAVLHAAAVASADALPPVRLGRVGGGDVWRAFSLWRQQQLLTAKGSSAHGLHTHYGTPAAPPQPPQSVPMPARSRTSSTSTATAPPAPAATGATAATGASSSSPVPPLDLSSTLGERSSRGRAGSTASASASAEWQKVSSRAVDSTDAEGEGEAGADAEGDAVGEVEAGADARAVPKTTGKHHNPAAAAAAAVFLAESLEGMGPPAPPAMLLTLQPAQLPTPFMTSPSTILTAHQSRLLEASLPRSIRSYEWRLLYSLRRDGASAATLLDRGTGHQPCLLVVQDAHGGVFGALMLEAWAKKTGFFGAAGSWCFTFEDRDEAEAVRSRMLAAEAEEARQREAEAHRAALHAVDSSTATFSGADDGSNSDGIAAAAAPVSTAGGSSSGAAATATASDADVAEAEALAQPAPPASLSNPSTHFHVFRSSRANKLYQLVDVHPKSGAVAGIGVGGGGAFAIWLDELLDRGRSGPCGTFFSPCLAHMPPGGHDDSSTTASSVNAGRLSSLAAATAAAASGAALPSLAALGPTTSFHALQVELWGFHRRTPQSAAEYREFTAPDPRT